jgi:hypothetical protein
MAYGWNSYGLVFSENSVSPTKVQVGYGDSILSRDAYSSKSIEEVISKVSLSPAAYGFSFNVGDLNTGELVNIEVSASGYNVYQISTNYSHTTMYHHLNVPQSSDPSSIARTERITEFVAPTTAKQVLAILGDTENHQYPIYRNAQNPDCCVTVTTTLFDLKEKTATIYTSNPKTSLPWRVFHL